MEGLGEEASALFSSLSPEVQGHVSSLAQLLDGSFSAEALGAVVGVEGARLKTVMRKFHDEAPLLVDSQSQRMCLEPLVLHHVRKLGHVTADDQVRWLGCGRDKKTLRYKERCRVLAEALSSNLSVLTNITNHTKKCSQGISITTITLDIFIKKHETNAI